MKIIRKQNQQDSLCRIGKIQSEQEMYRNIELLFISIECLILLEQVFVETTMRPIGGRGGGGWG